MSDQQNTCEENLTVYHNKLKRNKAETREDRSSNLVLGQPETLIDRDKDGKTANAQVYRDETGQSKTRQQEKKR